MARSLSAGSGHRTVNETSTKESGMSEGIFCLVVIAAFTVAAGF